MAKRVEGKVALVTGASQGIGKAIAMLLSKEGASVIVSDINDIDGMPLAEQIGGNYVSLDVSQEKEWENAMHTIAQRFGTLDILVNNAGIIGFQEGFGPQ